MKIFFGLATLILGLISIWAGIESNNGLFLIIIGIIIGYTGFRVLKS